MELPHENIAVMDLELAGKGAVVTGDWLKVVN
jgi:hypothetical protein